MTKNPFLNALSAVAYIALVATLITTLPHLPEGTINPIAPIVGVLSLFVFSAAVTGYLVLAAPLQLFLEGQKKEGIAFFFKTLISFAGIAIVLFLALFLLSFGQTL